VNVLATHEQVLGGDTGQVYIGCRFPADPAYVSELARHGEAIGKLLASRGVIGRLSVDFAATQNDSGKWHMHALEINLRKGGTTHPYVVLSHLVPRQIRSRSRGVEGVRRYPAVVLGDRQPHRRVVARAGA